MKNPTSRAAPRTMRRILVGLDASPASGAALDAALRLAAELGAELDALFVEDQNLMRFAGLPFTRVVGAYSAAPRDIVPADVERGARAQADRLRQTLASAAGAMAGNRVTWRFRVVRGDVAGEIMAAAEGADLLSLGFVGERPTGGAQAGSLVRRAVREAPHSLLLLRRAESGGMPVAVCLDGGADSAAALATAAALARAQGGRLTVVVLAADDAAAQAIETAAADQLGEHHDNVDIVRQPAAAGLGAALKAARGGVLVIGAKSELVADEPLDRLLDACSCSLLLAR